jgi:hypothetical protein
LECDVESQELYYVNTRDGTVRWDKPLLLGSKELDPPNRWYECRDMNGVTFYYHPYRMDATYTKPWDYNGDWYDDAYVHVVAEDYDDVQDIPVENNVDDFVGVKENDLTVADNDKYGYESGGFDDEYS